MPKAQASLQERQLLRALAANPGAASATQRAATDMMAHNLTMADVCDALWHWIVDDQPVTRITMHGGDPDDPHAPNRGSPS